MQTEPSLLHEVIEMLHLLVHMKNIETNKWKVLEKYKLSVMVLYIVTVTNMTDDLYSIVKQQVKEQTCPLRPEQRKWQTNASRDMNENPTVTVSMSRHVSN